MLSTYPFAMEFLALKRIEPRIYGVLLRLEPGIAAVIPAFHRLPQDTVLVAHKGAFDLTFLQLPDGTGIELIHWMRAHVPAVQAVVVSAFAEEEAIFSALRAGAVGYLLKDRDDVELVVALRSLQRGGAPIDPMIARRILALLPEEATPVPAAWTRAERPNACAAQ